MDGTLEKNRLTLEDSWSYKVTVLADMVARRVAAIVQTVSGLNLSQWRVIAAIADLPGRTASQVVDITPMDKGIVSRAVGTLVQKSLIERRASSRDGRLSHLFLTPSGEKVFEAIVAELDRTGASGRRNMPEDDQEKLLETLNRAIATYAEHE